MLKVYFEQKYIYGAFRKVHRGSAICYQSRKARIQESCRLEINPIDYLDFLVVLYKVAKTAVKETICDSPTLTGPVFH